MFHYYLLGGDTAALSGLYTRLCHAFLVFAFFAGIDSSLTRAQKWNLCGLFEHILDTLKLKAYIVTKLRVTERTQVLTPNREIVDWPHPFINLSISWGRKLRLSPSCSSFRKLRVSMYTCHSYDVVGCRHASV